MMLLSIQKKDLKGLRVNIYYGLLGGSALGLAMADAGSDAGVRKGYVEYAKTKSISAPSGGTFNRKYKMTEEAKNKYLTNYKK